VVALGNLRAGKTPTQTEVTLARFLFGTEPEPGLAIVSPTRMVGTPQGVGIADSVLDGVFWWSAKTGDLRQVSWSAQLDEPTAIDVTSAGNWLVSDRRSAARFDRDGKRLTVYQPGKKPFKPGGILALKDQVWVSNLATHQIEVFGLTHGEHQTSIGEPGHGPAQFSWPRGLARMPAGNVCVVDMLNNRVQVLSQSGEWIANVGQGGDTVGSFGRPRSVAVGPDGTIFVCDAFSQQVHAFAPNGQPLLAFGGPQSSDNALALPHGLAISTTLPPTDRNLPDGLEPAYYVLVAEQLNNPGVHVYAWLGDYTVEPMLRLPSGRGSYQWAVSPVESTAPNPHWQSDGCEQCHTIADGQALPIPRQQIDALCLNCHDGERAPADPHPIGRPALTAAAQTPANWPTIDGEISCITCHAIREHCDRTLTRPDENPLLLRGFTPQDRRDWCTTCHTAGSGGFNPHERLVSDGVESGDPCLFCHTEVLDIPPDGQRTFDAALRAESSALCMNCHAPHWDFSPRGHLQREVPAPMHEWMVTQEVQLHGSLHLTGRVGEERHPALLPLGDGEVTCYSCHNPHPPDLFSKGSVLGARAEPGHGYDAALRLNWMELCIGCHRQ
jgi:predicted CXXCH cytochrome family protein